MLDDLSYGIVFVYSFVAVVALFVLGALGILVTRSIGKLVGLDLDEPDEADDGGEDKKA